MIKRNFRVSPCYYTDGHDPFLDSGVNPDDNVREIAPYTESNQQSRLDVEQQSKVFNPQMTRLDRFSAAKRFTKSQESAASRIEDTYRIMASSNK